MQKRSVTISGHQTSVSLETEFWEALKTIAQIKEISVAGLIREIDTTDLLVEKKENLSSRIRIYILTYYLNKLRESKEIG